MPPAKPAPKATDETLREEFDRLRVQEDEAMKRATFVGMTADEAKEYEKRRNRLNELFERLYRLKP